MPAKKNVEIKVIVFIDDHTFFNFFILEGGHLPFFLNLRFLRSRFLRNLIFFASFILSFCSSLSFTFDSKGSFSTLTLLSFSLSAGGSASAGELESSAAAETINAPFFPLGFVIRTPLKGFKGRATSILEAVIIGEKLRMEKHENVFGRN